MAEPTSSAAAAGVAGWKIIGGAAGAGAIGAGMSAIVVMSLTPPRSPREWTVALISTVMGSIGGGAAVVQHFGLTSWADTYMGLVALMFVGFACGLPAWALVRWLFNFINKRAASDLADVVRDIKDLKG